MNLRERIEKIKTAEDAEEQVVLAKKYATKLRNVAKKQSTLENKLSMQKKVTNAEKTLRDIRRLIFDIEDALKTAYQPLAFFLKRCLFNAKTTIQNH